MERQKRSKIVVERFKASSKKMNQNLVDAVVRVQRRRRACKVKKAVSSIKEGTGPSVEEKHQHKDRRAVQTQALKLLMKQCNSITLTV